MLGVRAVGLGLAWRDWHWIRAAWFGRGVKWPHAWSGAGVARAGAAVSGLTCFGMGDGCVRLELARSVLTWLSLSVTRFDLMSHVWHGSAA